MDLSRFVYLLNKDNKYFVYSTLSNCFIEVDPALYRNLLHLQNGSPDSNQLDKETLNQLKNLKIIDVDDNIEIAKIKFRNLSSRFNPKTLFLTINPTLSCNFACPYCFESSHSPIFMSDETENQIIEFIRQRRLATKLAVSWFGGEPLLSFDRIISLTKKFLDLDLDYTAGMISNGYLLTEEKIKKFKDLRIKTVQITIDGKEATHNSRRFLKNGGKTFNRIIENVLTAQKISPEIRIIIRVNVDKDNEEEFIDVWNFFKSLNLPNIVVYPGFTTDKTGENRSECMFDNNASAKFLMELYYKYGIYIPVFYPPAYINSCVVRNPNAVVIGPEGELYKCWNDVGNSDRIYGYLDGRITNENILYEYLTYADQFNDKECLECRFLPACSGGCPYERIISKKKGLPQPCPMIKDNTDDFLLLQYKYRTAERNHNQCIS